MKRKTKAVAEPTQREISAQRNRTTKEVQKNLYRNEQRKRSLEELSNGLYGENKPEVSARKALDNAAAVIAKLGINKKTRFGSH